MPGNHGGVWRNILSSPPPDHDSPVPPVPNETSTYPLTGRFLAGRLRHALREPEKEYLESLVSAEERSAEDRMILRRGESSGNSTMLVDGFVLRVIRRGGNESIVGLHVPGDFVDLHSFALKRLDHDLVAVGRTHCAYFPHKALARAIVEQPRLARILWMASLLDAALHRAWILKLERLRASERLAHLFCEMWCRLQMVDADRPDGFASPFTQAHLASMCGISVIHANRALASLRDAGLAQFRRGRLFADDREALAAHGRFSADYLYGEGTLHISPGGFEGG